jgi:MFS family permease
MAVGPFVGAAVLGAFELGPALDAAGAPGWLAEVLAPSWRWIFHLGAPLAIVAMSWVWAAAPSWPTERRPGHLDAVGAVLWSAALAAGLVALTALGEPSAEGGLSMPLLAGAIAVVATLAALRHAARTPEPFLDPGLLRNRVFSGAMLLSLLTGYALATAIVGGAVFIDRVRYGGPEQQQVVLGGLALAMSVGALGSGFLLRRLGIVPLSIGGIVLSALGLVVLAGCGPGTDQTLLIAGLVLFGLGFGLTVTPRSSAAVEALGRTAFGVASAGVTVARMAGMAVGLAVLTGFGTTRIESLSVVLTDPAARDAVLPPALQGRPLQDPLVIGALEAWASLEAAQILRGLFLVAAVVMLVGILPTLLMRDARSRGGRATMPRDSAPSGDDDGAQPALSL